MRIAPLVVLTSEQRAKREAFARGRSRPARFVTGARMVLLAAQGKQELKMAYPLLIAPRIAARWRSRFCATVPPGWSTTLLDLAARLPLNGTRAHGDCHDTGKTFSWPLEDERANRSYREHRALRETCTTTAREVSLPGCVKYRLVELLDLDNDHQEGE
jgi:hypothetical protein